MSKAIASISVSLDGYFTGPNPGPGQGLGEGGAVLHQWIREGTASREQLAGNEFIRELLERGGAIVSGRDSYDTAEKAWGPEPPFRVPIFVVTHNPLPDDIRVGTTFHFVDGFEQALDLPAKPPATPAGEAGADPRRRGSRRHPPRLPRAPLNPAREAQ